jgi:hypothetical protein
MFITTDISQKLNHLRGKLTKLIIFFNQKFTIQKINPKIKYASISLVVEVSIDIQK